MTRHASAWGLLLAVLLLSAMLYAAPLNFAEAYLWTAQTLMGETGQTAVWMLGCCGVIARRAHCWGLSRSVSVAGKAEQKLRAVHGVPMRWPSLAALSLLWEPSWRGAA